MQSEGKIIDLAYISSKDLDKPHTKPLLKSRHKLETVAFFGSADILTDDPLYQEVYEAARAVSLLGKTIVNGGGPGVMKAATNGAKSVSGKTLAVTFFPNDMPEFEGRDNGNIVDLEIRTSNYPERLTGLISESDLIICFQGGTGTLSEWAMVWLLGHLYGSEHKPMILYGAFWHEFMACVSKYFLIGESEKNVYTIVSNQQELMQALENYE